MNRGRDRRDRRCSSSLLVLSPTASLFTVDQTEQVLITQFGQPVRVITEPGLHVKMPFVQTVITFDKRPARLRAAGRGGHPRRPAPADRRQLRACSASPIRCGTTRRSGRPRTASARRLNSVVSVGAAPRARQRAAARRAVGAPRPDHGDDPRPGERRDAGLRRRRSRMCASAAPTCRRRTPRRSCARMQSERAARRRAGARRGRRGVARKIRADAERERTVLLAEARATADKLRGEGEARGDRASTPRPIQQDPHFFSVWRTLQAYRDSLRHRRHRGWC